LLSGSLALTGGNAFATFLDKSYDVDSFGNVTVNWRKEDARRWYDAANVPVTTPGALAGGGGGDNGGAGLPAPGKSIGYIRCVLSHTEYLDECSLGMSTAPSSLPITLNYPYSSDLYNTLINLGRGTATWTSSNGLITFSCKGTKCLLTLR
jgi:hypothetical protein